MNKKGTTEIALLRDIIRLIFGIKSITIVRDAVLVGAVDSFLIIRPFILFVNIHFIRFFVEKFV